MMLFLRKSVATGFFVAACFSLCSAQIFPDFGLVTVADRELKKCSFDPEASSVVLLDEAIAYPNEERNLITDHRVRIKILAEKGIEDANISIPFYSKDDFEFVSDIEGRIANETGGNMRSEFLEKKLIYTKKINEYYSEKTFTFPGVKVGSIIEYSYRSTMKHYGGLENWNFQKYRPVVRSKFTVTVLSNLEFAYQVQKGPSYNIDIKRDEREGKISFEMKDLPSLSDEPYMDARKDYIQSVTFQLAGFNRGYGKTKYMTSWEEVTRELNSSSSFGTYIGKNVPGSDDFVKLTKENRSSFEKMKIVYDYVRSNMLWNGINTIYINDGLKQPWSKKTGTTAEINMILINLLKDVGIEVYPMLVSERWHGKVNTQYPFVDQFNSVYALVIIDGRKYYLDATDKSTPAHIIPYSILNTTAFVVSRKNGGLITIKDESFKYQDLINLTATIDKEGHIIGSAYVRSDDYARAKRLSLYRKGRETYIDRYFRKSTKTTTIDSFTVDNETTDTLPLIHHFKFNTQANESGNYVMLPSNLFSEYTDNPFTDNMRFSNINFGYRQSVSLNSYYDIPAGYLIDAIPKPIQLTNEDKSIMFTRNTAYDEATMKVVTRIRIDLNKSQFEADEYLTVKAFYKKMFDLLNEPVVLKKK